MKKLNAVCTLVMSALMLAHTLVMCYSLFTGWYSYPLCKGLGLGAVLVMTIHGALALIIVFFLHDGSALTEYPRQNIRTILQRGSALILILLLHAHMVNYSFIASGTPLTTAGMAKTVVTEILFVTALSVHTVTSFSKAFITLGIVISAEAVKKTDRAVIVVTCAIGIVSVCGVIRFLAGWMS